MARTKSSIVWSWWTMSYRAFHAGTVCAFLAIREPGTELAERCLADLRSAIRIFDDRSSNWNVSHPVQGDLSAGLHRLEKLATAATQQTDPRPEPAFDNSPSAPIFPNMAVDPSIPSFPSFAHPAHAYGADHLSMLHGVHPGNGHGEDGPSERNQSRRSSAPFLQPWTLTQPESGMTSPFTTEPLALPQVSGAWPAYNHRGWNTNAQIWASMFNIKMDPEMGDDHGMQQHGLLPGSHPQPEANPAQ